MVKSVFQTLTLLGLSAAVHSFDITFSTPFQCGNVQIAWTASSRPAEQLTFPLLLHILPFDSTAITSPIPGWNASMTSGIAQLPFALSGGTKFLLAVTDSDGRGAGPVSEVKTAIPSGDTTCLSSTPQTPGQFQVFTTSEPTACPSLTVDWVGTVKSQRPTILAFSTGFLPLDLDPPSAPPPLERIVTSNGTFTSSSQVVILFRDGDSPGRTSQFLTVGGTERDGCSNPSTTSLMGQGAWTTPTSSTMPNQTMAAGHVSLSSINGGARVVGGVAAGIVGLSVVLFIIFAYRARRYRAAQTPIPHSRMSSDTIPSMTHTGLDITLPSPTPHPSPASSSGGTEPVEDPVDSSLTPVPSSPTPPSGPLTRRRSWVARPGRLTLTDASSFLYLNSSDANSPSADSSLKDSMKESMKDAGETRPDSPTIPDSRSMRQVAIPLPTTPLTPRARSVRSERSQRSEKRERYLKLDPSSEIEVSEAMRSPRSASYRANRPKKAR